MSTNPYESPREANDPPPEPPSKLMGLVSAMIGLLILGVWVTVITGEASRPTPDWIGTAIASAMLGSLAVGLLTFGIGRMVEHERTEMVGGIILLVGLILIGIAILGALAEMLFT